MPSREATQRSRPGQAIVHANRVFCDMSGGPLWINGRRSVDTVRKMQFHGSGPPIRSKAHRTKNRISLMSPVGLPLKSKSQQPISSWGPSSGSPQSACTAGWRLQTVIIVRATTQKCFQPDVLSLSQLESHLWKAADFSRKCRRASRCAQAKGRAGGALRGGGDEAAEGECEGCIDAR